MTVSLSRPSRIQVDLYFDLVRRRGKQVMLEVSFQAETAKVTIANLRFRLRNRLRKTYDCIGGVTGSHRMLIADAVPRMRS